MMMRGGGGGGGERASSSCAACKLLKRRCRATCIFAPYFRSDEAKKFAKVHKVFGASNVSKILGEVPEEHREDAVNSLAYEAEARLLDPVYGCIGAIALLHRRLSDLHRDLAIARARLARYAPTTTTTNDYAAAVAVPFDHHDHSHGGNCAVVPAAYFDNCSGVSTSSTSSSSSFGGVGGQTTTAGSLEFGHHQGYYSAGYGNVNATMYDYGFVPYIL